MSSQTQAFLERVLPDEGFYVAYIVSGTTRKNVFAPTRAELADLLLKEDAKGLTTYHACASFRQKENDPRGTPPSGRKLGRTHANALYAKAFWLDVDAGEDKPYADATAAAEAVILFCRTNNLPVPIFVRSGKGLHIYWPLEQNIPAETWRSYAGGLKQICAVQGLAADPVRTADISSVLRPPGTHHRKQGERKVLCGPLTGPYPLSAFDIFLKHANQKPFKTIASPASGRAASIITAAIKVYGDEPKYGETVAAKCAQVRKLKEEAEHQSEPEWYASLGVLAYCVDGEELAHKWSSNYDGYSEPETSERLARQKSFGPTTCQHFESLCRDACTGCPFKGKITSPIQLGRKEPVIEKQVNGAPCNGSLFSTDAEVKPLGILEKVFIDGIEAIKPPSPYCFRGKALCLSHETNNGDDDFELVSTYPIFLKSVQTGEVQNDRFSLMFMHKLPHEDWKQLSIPAGQLFGQQGGVALADRGVIVHDLELFKDYARKAVDMWNANNRLAKRYDQFGWKEGETAFLYGLKLYAPDSIMQVMGSSEIKTRSQWLQPKPGGSLERWSSAANSLFAAGCEPQSLALLCSFAAPLMRFHSEAEGGAILSLLSRKSGSGKTTALTAAASVWGMEKGLSITNIDTKVSKGLTLAALGNLPAVHDELGNRDPEVVRDFVIMFTNGRDKMRGTQEGEIRHTQSSWQTILISAANASLVDVLVTKGTDAPAYRVLEFSTELPTGVHRKGDSLKKELEANCGYAGDAYLRYIMQPAVLTWIKAALPHWTDGIWQKTKLQSQHRFWVRTLGSVAVAAAVVKKLGILEFSPERIMEWAIDEIMKRVDDMPSIEVYHSPIELLNEFLNSHIANTLVMPGPFKPHDKAVPLLKNIQRLIVRYELSHSRILIQETYLREWLIKNKVSPKEFMQDLYDKGVILRQRISCTLGAGTDIAGGQVHCTEVNGAHHLMTGALRVVSGFNAAAPQEERRANASPRPKGIQGSLATY